MNKDKYVFSQLVTFLDEFKFLRIVKKYEGNKYIKSYTCWNQLLTMMFGQLSNRETSSCHWRLTPENSIIWESASP